MLKQCVLSLLHAAVQTPTVLQYSVPAVVGVEWTTEGLLALSCSNQAGG